MEKSREEGGRKLSLTTFVRKMFGDFVKLELRIKPWETLILRVGQIPTQLHIKHLCLGLHLFSMINPHMAAALLGLTGVSHTHTSAL